MRQGDKNGIYIVDLQKKAILWYKYAQEQAEYMFGLGLDPDATDETPMQQICYGHLQHHQIKPMYGQGGDAAFQEARNLWGEHVKAALRELIKNGANQTEQKAKKKTYVSPFDGRVK